MMVCKAYKKIPVAASLVPRPRPPSGACKLGGEPGNGATLQQQLLEEEEE